jgi:hypothetical protein
MIHSLLPVCFIMNKQEKATKTGIFKYSCFCGFIFYNPYMFYSKIAAIPGNTIPSRLSNMAPPPVLT